MTFPTPNKAHGQYHWTFERLLSAALVPLVGATAVSSANPVLDGILCTAIVAHSHMVSPILSFYPERVHLSRPRDPVTEPLLYSSLPTTACRALTTS